LSFVNVNELSKEYNLQFQCFLVFEENAHINLVMMGIITQTVFNKLYKLAKHCTVDFVEFEEGIPY